MTQAVPPSLFGLQHSNRNFAKSEFWGKNQFNSSFPAALTCWMGEHGINPVYLRLNQSNQVYHDEIRVETLFGLPVHDPNLYFHFEDAFTPYSDLIVGKTPRADLVIRHAGTPGKNALSSFEIKLTALPDSTTYDKADESLWGSELVVRPDTIVYIALSIAHVCRDSRDFLLQALTPACTNISDWQEGQEVRPHMNRLIAALEQVLAGLLYFETPFLLQPVFKTQGKKSVLSDQCLDCFVWSNFALATLFLNQAKNPSGNISRYERSSVWLFKMLLDFANNGRVDPEVIDLLTYNTKNDKAFASAGNVTNQYMKCEALEHPRVPKAVLREIILGGGQHFLSPERRFDAIIVNTPGLFD
jgi:HindVP restriction endonuclease